MNRSCQCGGIIREAGKPFWDILPTCSCSSPVMVNYTTTWTTGTAALSPQPRTRKHKADDAKSENNNGL